ncbi:FAD:protein FMN transferase [Streptomyces sp. VRA16 Mangrove soil]|uniref:FAD:protein FMN transferase n=1 Tax=Streptomyces sp. VRA16 Mangrove soil TaxID=2817434 RepID=UPI001A9F25E9|nr:FAD:protein FMN transferase [Streptomyces sp. VRA16 Mangrove soil]MBO1331704.1 FAD:protein FMN transferase [Streptomyces sp. VRA16 Mangrove soil]
MAERAGPHRVVHTMGTVFSFTVRDASTPLLERALDEAEALLRHVDRVFSTYREDSAVSALARGERVPEAWRPEVDEVLALCARAERESEGWFSVRHSAGLDPSGLVKGWAVERAAELLWDAGAGSVCVNGGGDVQLHGGPWRVGVTHPLEPGKVAAVVSSQAGPLAVATSGTAERGCHIVDPHTGEPPVGAPASLTVVCAGLTRADTLATAAYARGAGAREWLEEQPGIGSFAVAADGSTWTTGTFGAPATPIQV